STTSSPFTSVSLIAFQMRFARSDAFLLLANFEGCRMGQDRLDGGAAAAMCVAAVASSLCQREPFHTV
ncbi:MAG: hypothetical protein ACLUKD_14725, partial [Eggerthella lenta]